ncbi:paxillin isoform X1 [Galleria mellonella]|uniref:Paxillin isoform X1 n=1 Tax=Galleria mellonella TaxID=7137 RepID=A0ABM3MVA6_GALME|nr:paxillin isoform X1 [Galleria mellonella]
MASVRTRSASPKTVSFSPVLERKYSAERGPSNPPELSSTDWRRYFTDFSAYLDALLADLQNSIHPGGRVGSPGGRTGSPGGRTTSPGRTSSPGGRGSPGRLSSPGGSLSSPTSTGYGSINGSRNISSDYIKPSSPTYQNTSGVHEKVIPVKYTGSQSNYGSQSPGYNAGSPGYNAGQSAGYGRTTGGRGNMSELDTLLDDLSNARYGNYGEKTSTYNERTDGYARTNGATSPASSRPTVDSLLDQLSTDIPNGRSSTSPIPPSSGTLPRPGTKQVTVTVQETVVEPAQAQQQPPTTVAPHRHHYHASSATKELDDLMASLSDFKVSGAGGEGGTHVYREKRAWQEHYRSSPRQPESASLEHMLGSLRADMSRQGVQTPQKGCCNACEKPIVGQVITALGRTWHPEHFTCAHCNQELGTRNFFEREGRPYCEPDYHNLFSPRCAYCNGPILDKCVTALEKTWHTEHFFCAQCGQQFGEDGFHERDGKPYCRADYFDMFAPKCGGCNKPIMENYISALNTQWHPDCFVCKECREPFHGGSFFEHEGQPYCETHYHGKRGSLCAGCHKPIAGRCITAMFRKFHPEHFVCAFCLRQLNKGTFKEQNDKPYCHACFDKLFG